MRWATIAFVVLVLTGCGGATTITHHRRPTIPTTTPTTTPTPPEPVGPVPAISSCSYLHPSASNCEQVPAAGSCHFHMDGATPLPDQRCTPGALNAAVTATTLRTTICKSGYTTTIRPPLAYTGPLKRKIMAAYGLAGASPALYELDHLVPLEGGGAPSDPANLWPQPYSPTPGAHQKDDEENYMRSKACGSVATSLPARQAEIAQDWVALYRIDKPPHVVFGAAGQ